MVRRPPWPLLKSSLLPFDEPPPISVTHTTPGAAGIHPEAQHTGYYNDLDMMVIGMRGMTEPWERVHMGLWALSGSPLMVGADITRLKRSSLAMFTNTNILAVHNDLLGVQAVKVAEPKPGLQVWAKPLAMPGKRAVVLLNRTESAAVSR